MAKIGVVILFCFGYSLFAVGLLVIVFVLPSFDREPRSVDSLLTLPTPAATFPCNIFVRRDETTTGLDRGAVTFLDGWLYFEGYRTSFSLSRNDVVKRRQSSLELADSTIGFQPDRAVALEFTSVLDRWYRIDSSARGISILPPLTVHPSARARSWVELLFAAGKMTISVTVLFASLLLFHQTFWFVLILSGPIELIQSMRSVSKLRRMTQGENKILPNENSARLGR